MQSTITTIEPTDTVIPTDGINTDMPATDAVSPAEPLPTDTTEPTAEPISVPADTKPAGNRAARRAAASGKRKPTGKPAAAAKPTGKPDTGGAYYAAARDASGVAANATHYGDTTSRDDAYIAFYTLAAKRKAGVTVTLAALHDSGTPVDASKPRGKRRNPLYIGSAKATDVGAINRAHKAGHLRPSGDGTSFVLTERGAERGRAVLAKLRRPGTGAEPSNG